MKFLTMPPDISWSWNGHMPERRTSHTTVGFGEPEYAGLLLTEQRAHDNRIQIYDRLGRYVGATRGRNTRFMLEVARAILEGAIMDEWEKEQAGDDT